MSPSRCRTFYRCAQKAPHESVCLQQNLCLRLNAFAMLSRCSREAAAAFPVCVTVMHAYSVVHWLFWKATMAIHKQLHIVTSAL